MMNRKRNVIGPTVVVAAIAASAAFVWLSRRHAPVAEPIRTEQAQVEEKCPPIDAYCSEKEHDKLKLDDKFNNVKDAKGNNVPNKCYHLDDCHEGNGVCEPEKGEGKDSVDCVIEALDKDPCIPGEEGAKAPKLKRPLFSAKEFYLDQLKRGIPFSFVQRSQNERRMMVANLIEMTPGDNYFVKLLKREESCKLKDEKSQPTIDCAPGVDTLCYCVNFCGPRPKKADPRPTPPPAPTVTTPVEPPATIGPCEKLPEDEQKKLGPARNALNTLFATSKREIFEDHGIDTKNPLPAEIGIVATIVFTKGTVTSAQVTTNCRPLGGEGCPKPIIKNSELSSEVKGIEAVEGGPSCVYTYRTSYKTVKGS